MANMPLTDIGITPRKASQFASKGIETVTDLLGYYPTKYLDFRNPISFAEGKYHQGEHVAIKGKVVSGRVIDGKHYMLRLSDGNTFCTVFWFNQPFRTRQFSVGDVIALNMLITLSVRVERIHHAGNSLRFQILTGHFPLVKAVDSRKGYVRFMALAQLTSNVSFECPFRNIHDLTFFAFRHNTRNTVTRNVSGTASTLKSGRRKPEISFVTLVKSNLHPYNLTF